VIPNSRSTKGARPGHRFGGAELRRPHALLLHRSNELLACPSSDCRFRGFNRSDAANGVQRMNRSRWVGVPKPSLPRCTLGCFRTILGRSSVAERDHAVEFVGVHRGCREHDPSRSRRGTIAVLVLRTVVSTYSDRLCSTWELYDAACHRLANERGHRT
jgi:hypothetical protein